MLYKYFTVALVTHYFHYLLLLSVFVLTAHVLLSLLVAVWCSGNALVSINAVALHRARLVLGWVTAFGQVNCLIM